MKADPYAWHDPWELAARERAAGFNAGFSNGYAKAEVETLRRVAEPKTMAAIEAACERLGWATANDPAFKTGFNMLVRIHRERRPFAVSVGSLPVEQTFFRLVMPPYEITTTVDYQKEQRRG